MNVADLFASFGYKIDEASIAAADAALAKTRRDAEAASDTAKLSAALTHVHGDAGKALDLIGLNAEATQQAMAGASKSTTSWGKAIVVANQALGIGLKLLGGIQRGVGFVRGLVSATEAQAAQAVELAARLGISAEAVQELGFAASQEGSSLEELSDGMRNLANQVDAAGKGGKTAAAALRDVGVTASDVTSGQQSLDGTLGQIAEKFAAMPDGAKKSALAVDLFGKSGAKLIPLLNRGSAGIDELRDEARELGAVIDNDTAAALEGFGDETAKAGAQLDGLRNQAIAAILPTLTEMVKGLQAWIKANRQLLVSALTGALRGLLVVLQAVGYVMAGVVQVVAFFAEHSTLAIALLGGLAAAFLYMGITAAAAWLAATWPLVLLAAAIAGLILLFPRIVAAAQALGRGVVRAIEWIGDKFKAMGRGVADVFRAIGRFFAGLGDGIKGAFVTAIDWVIERLNDAIGLVNKLIRGFNKLPAPDIGEIGRIDTLRRKPTLSSGRTAQVNIQSAPTFNIQGGSGVDTEQLATRVNQHVDSYFNARLQEAADGIG